MSYNGPSMVERAGNIYTSSLPRIHSARGGTPPSPFAFGSSGYGGGRRSPWMPPGSSGWGGITLSAR